MPRKPLQCNQDVVIAASPSPPGSSFWLPTSLHATGHQGFVKKSFVSLTNRPCADAQEDARPCGLVSNSAYVAFSGYATALVMSPSWPACSGCVDARTCPRSGLISSHRLSQATSGPQSSTLERSDLATMQPGSTLDDPSCPVKGMHLAPLRFNHRTREQRPW